MGQDGVLDPNMYLKALVTIHGTILIFWVLTAGLTGTFTKFLIPLQIGLGIWPQVLLIWLSYWFFFYNSLTNVTFVETGPGSTGMDYLPSTF